MHVIKVLGSGCSNCTRTADLIKSVVEDMEVAAEVVKEQDLAKIMAYGVMSTPGVVIDDKVVHAGGVPSRTAVEKWIGGLETP
jgi:small redox-active disulfide protein 2